MKTILQELREHLISAMKAHGWSLSSKRVGKDGLLLSRSVERGVLQELFFCQMARPRLLDGKEWSAVGVDLYVTFVQEEEVLCNLLRQGESMERSLTYGIGSLARGRDRVTFAGYLIDPDADSEKSAEGLAEAVVEIFSPTWTRTQKKACLVDQDYIPPITNPARWRLRQAAHHYLVGNFETFFTLLDRAEELAQGSADQRSSRSDGDAKADPASLLKVSRASADDECLKHIGLLRKVKRRSVKANRS